MRRLKLIARFYTDIFLANFLVTLSCIWMRWFYAEHVHLILPVIFWFKVISVFSIFFLAIYSKQKELYYYQNLGVSKWKLGAATTLFDITLFLILFINTFNI